MAQNSFVIQVDAVNGTDATIPTSLTQPLLANFLTTSINNQNVKTLENALEANNKLKNLGLTGIIHVKPGNYNITSNFRSLLQSDPVNTVKTTMQLDKGVVFHNKSTTPMIEDSVSKPINLEMIGECVFKNESENALVNGVFQQVVHGPIVKLNHASSTISLQCDEIVSKDASSFVILEGKADIIINKSLYCDGSVQMFELYGKSIRANIKKISGNCNGFKIASVVGEIRTQEIDLPNGVVDFQDPVFANHSTNFDPNQDSGVSKFYSDYIKAKNLQIQTDWGNLHWDVKTAFFTQQINLTTNNPSGIFTNRYIETLPSIEMNMESLHTPSMIVSAQIGNIKINLTNILNMTPRASFVDSGPEVSPGGGTLVVKGNTDTSTSSSTFININHLVAFSMYLGCLPGTGFPDSSSWHKSGMLEANIKFAQLEKYVVCTSENNTSTGKAYVMLRGGVWVGRGYLSAQTNGMIDCSVSQMKKTVNNGGVLEIFNNEIPASNDGKISIHDCKVINTITSQGVSDTTVCVKVDSTTDQKFSCVNSVLALNIPYNDAVLKDVTNRTNEPVYPIENFGFPPTLKITSYKAIPRKHASPTTHTVYWTGTNQVDTSINNNV